MHRIPPPPHKMHRPFRYRACIPATAARTSPRPEDRTEQTPSGTAPYEFPTDGYLPAARDRKTDARISGHSVICVPEHTERGYLLYPDSAQSDQRLPVRSEPQKQGNGSRQYTCGCTCSSMPEGQPRTRPDKRAESRFPGARPGSTHAPPGPKRRQGRKIPFAPAITPPLRSVTLVPAADILPSYIPAPPCAPRYSGAVFDRYANRPRPARYADDVLSGYAELPRRRDPQPVRRETGNARTLTRPDARHRGCPPRRNRAHRTESARRG